MCATCGCVLGGASPNDTHGDDRNITLGELEEAAAAQAIDVRQAAQNALDTLAFLDDQEATQAVVKQLAVGPNPKRYVLGVAYAPNEIDGHGDWISEEELEKTAWEYVRKHRRIGFYHIDGTEGHGEVVESYIYRGPDWEMTDISGQRQVIKSGTWLLGAQLDEVGFGLVLREQADGWSMDGLSKYRVAEPPQ